MVYVWKKFNTCETNKGREHELLTNINNSPWVTYDVNVY